MADFWDQFPLYEAGGITGQPSVDPSQLALAPGGATSQGGGVDDPRWTNGTWGSPSISLQNPAPTSPMLPQNGSQGGPIPPGYVLQNAPGGDTPGSNWGYAPPSTTFNGNTNTGVAGGSTGQPWDQNYFASTFGQPKTPQELVALEQKIVAAGGKVLRNASGVAGKIQTPDGRVIDVINSAGAGGNGFQWLEGPGGGGGGGNNLASLGYGFGSSMAPWNEQFAAPNPEQIANDPYYQFQMKEGMKGIQNSAAAKGTLLTGGTLKGLEQYGQGLASSFGDKAYDRGMNEYLLRRDNFFQNEDRPFSKNVTLANLGRPQ